MRFLIFFLIASLAGCASYDRAHGSYEASRAAALCEGAGFQRGTMNHSQCVIELIAARAGRGHR